MTLEHKILALIDQGVRTEDGISALLDGEPVAEAIAQAIYGILVIEAYPTLSLTDHGLDRLNSLDGGAA